MMRIVRKRKVKIDGVEVEVEACTRGPFRTDSFFRDGKDRRLVIELHSDHFIIRYARSKKPIARETYDVPVRRAIAERWKTAPRGRRRK